MIALKLDDSQVQSTLRQLHTKLGNLHKPMDEIGQYTVESVRKRFATSTGPDGQAWAARKSSTISAMLDQRKNSRKKDGSLSASGQKFLSGSKILVASGALEGSIAYEATSSSMTVKPGALPYAAAHQFGNSPYVIRPKNKKALAFNGIVRKKVNHPGQTARPYLGWSDEDRSAIMDIMKSYLHTT